MATNTICLRIKSPSVSVPDISLSELTVTTTVLDVKRRIQREFETHPAPESQKLVYAGKLLVDNMELGAFLRFEDDVSVHTFHLVCKIDQVAIKRTEATVKNQPSTAAATSASDRDGLRWRPSPGTLQRETACADTTQQPTPANFDIGSYGQAVLHYQTLNTLVQELNNSHAAGGGTAGELEAMYNEYTELYNQYIQSLTQAQNEPIWAGAIAQTAGLDVVSGAAEPARVNNELVVPQQQPDIQPQLQPEGAGGGLGMAPVAAAGPEEEADLENNDFLARLYAMTRLVIILSVIYFHSSFWRLGLVICLGYLVYFFQNRQQQRAIRTNNNNNNVPNENVANDDGQFEEVDGDEDSDSLVEGQPAAERNAESQKPSLFTVIINMVTTFFSSMLPANQTVIQ